MKFNSYPVWLRLLHFVLMLGPPVLLISLLSRYQIDLPVWDQWPQVDLLDKLFTGQLTFLDIWRQHNEHRQPFPRVIMLGMAYVSHWNMSWEIVFNLLVGAACLGIFGHQVIKTLKVGSYPVAAWFFPLLSLLVFSIAQFENWIWGFAINIYLHIFCVLGAIVLLSHPIFGWPRFIGAMMLSIVATYSAPTAFFLWPLGSILLLTVHLSQARRRAWPAILWLLIGIASLAIYFHDFAVPAQLERTQFYRQPLAYARFVLNYLGSPILRGEYSYIAGLIGLCTFGYTPWRLIRDNTFSLPQLAPYLALGLFVIGAALLAGVGRVGLGDGLSSRYVSISLWFWAANLALAHFWMSAGNRQKTTTSETIGTLLIISAAILVSVDILGIEWRFDGQPYWPWLALVSLGFVTYLALTTKRPNGGIRHAGLFFVLLAGVLIAENSLRDGGKEAIWYQHHHLGAARELVLSSGKTAFVPDAPLDVFSPEFPARITRARLAILERHRLAAYRE